MKNATRCHIFGVLLDKEGHRTHWVRSSCLAGGEVVVLVRTLVRWKKKKKK